MIVTAKRGFKVCVMADPSNGCYMYDVHGSNKGVGDWSRRGGAQIGCLDQRNHQLYFDTSISHKPSDQVTRGTYACGTIRTNQKHYSSEINTEAQKFKGGEFTFCQCGNVGL